MPDDNDDYRSSDDEDYEPEVGVEDIEDEQSGDEDGTIITGSRRKPKKQNDSKKEKSKPESTVKIDASAILDMLDDEDPLLAPSKTQTEETKNASITTTTTTTVKTPCDPASVPSTSFSETKTVEKSKITEVFDFAGEEITIEREITSEELQVHEEKVKKLNEAEAKKPQKRAGLAGALTMLKKKPKISVLDKSNHDWNAYKDEHKIHEELATHNRGKDGYLSKVDFLTRTDYREFENEKALRNSTKKT